MPFQVTVGERKFRTDDLLLDEAIAIEKETGRSWLQINPLRSAEDCRAVLRAFLTRDLGAEGAAQKLAGLSVREVLELVKYVPDDLPDYYEDGFPKAEVDPETAGSSPVPVASGGPPT